MSVNIVLLRGRVGADPDYKIFGTGKKKATFQMAMNTTYTDKAGNKRQKVVWVPVSFWGRLAELAVTYVKKGHMIFIQGALINAEWEKDGKKIRRLEVIGTVLEFSAAPPPEPDPDEPPF